MSEAPDLLPGTLSLLVLKAVSLGRVHGYGVLLRIGEISGGDFDIQQGALYPALHRLEHRGLIFSEWGTSHNNRRAKYYYLTDEGRKRLGQDVLNWERLTRTMSRVLSAEPQEG